jgi:hypothetical protein
MVVTTGDAPFEPADDILVADDQIDEFISPLILSTVGNLMGSFLQESLNVPYFNDFPPDPHPNANTIVTSQIELFSDSRLDKASHES